MLVLLDPLCFAVLNQIKLQWYSILEIFVFYKWKYSLLFEFQLQTTIQQDKRKMNAEQMKGSNSTQAWRSKLIKAVS